MNFILLNVLNSNLSKALSIGHSVGLFHMYTGATITEINEEIFDLTDAWYNYRFLYIKTGNGNTILNSCIVPIHSLIVGNIIDLGYYQSDTYKYTRVELLDGYTQIKLTLGSWSNITIYGVM